ncbi:MAG: M20/M25/M40 family metallo-hydrolase [Elusimicrobiota bacterium]
MISPMIKTFCEMAEIISPSRKEKQICEYVKKELSEISSEIIIDETQKFTQSETGNLIVKIPGDKKLKPFLLSAHLDTVSTETKPNIIVKNGFITTANKTILGADCKAGIAIIIHAVKELIKEKINHPPLELVFSVCEEIGLLGTRFMKKDLLKSKYGLVFDNEKKINEVVISSVGVDNFTIDVKGIAAHSGVEPEKGVSAISIISKIISQITQGRISKNTTINIGFVKGGSGINIVPPFAQAEGEIRSFDLKEIIKVESKIKQIVDFVSSQKEYKKSKCLINIRKRFESFSIEKDKVLLKNIENSYKKIGLKAKFIKSFGGTDANNFFKMGIKTANIPTGMKNVHTPYEKLNIKEAIISKDVAKSIIAEMAKE